MRRRERKAVTEIGKPLKKIISDFSEIGKPLKKIKFWAKKIGFWARKISIFPTTFSSFWRFWGLVLTPNLLPCARMDLLDWFFSFSTTHNFSFWYHKLKQSSTGHPVLSCNPFTQQVTSPKQVTLGASILGLSFFSSKLSAATTR